MRYGSRQFGRQHSRFVQDVQPPQKAYIHYSDFRGGYDSSDDNQDTPQNASQYSMDMEVTVHDSLKRAAGVALDENLSKVVKPQLILHSSLENRSELLVMAPPFIGVKTTGPISWKNVALPGGSWYAHTNFGGSLIFSSGQEGVFVRQPETDTIEELVDGPVARTYATFAGRVFAGGATIDGTREPLGIAWSAANGNYEDWHGIGAGFELLIANVMTGDSNVSLKPMGLDFMAILNRRSIWVARRTGLRDRPADFQPRVPGVGAVNEATICVTRFGVLFLSDTGVFLFDGNNAELISKPINRELLPLDFTKIDSYSASYNPFTKRYYLFTPDETWVYDLDYNRWYHRSLKARAASVFAQQFDALTWAELQGDWANQDNIWAAYSPEEGNEFSYYVLREKLGTWSIGVESEASLVNFDTALAPSWWTKIDQSDLLTTQLLIDDVLVKYTGDGLLKVFLPDMAGQFEELETIDLGASVVPTFARSRRIHSGNGLGVKVELVSGDVEIMRLSLGATAESPRIESPFPEATP